MFSCHQNSIAHYSTFYWQTVNWNTEWNARVFLLTPDSYFSLRKIAYSDMEESTLDYEGYLVKKKHIITMWYHKHVQVKGLKER